jgi:hypothetical protein
MAIDQGIMDKLSFDSRTLLLFHDKSTQDRNKKGISKSRK